MQERLENLSVGLIQRLKMLAGLAVGLVSDHEEV